ncbi:lactate utilization protein [Colwellia sp. KU-HH00111]|uniref:LutC/YkgG family protein n=1 Tax=Colwellia sp. KU-HH00111 TaxID=3127652 RepID=UPI0031080CDB
MKHSEKPNIEDISTSARASILAKIKAQVVGADYDKLPQENAFVYPTLNKTEQLAQFYLHLEANHAQVIKLAEADLASVISAELNKRAITSLLYGKNTDYATSMASLAPQLQLQAYDFSIDDHKASLFNDYPAAVSSSRCAISATGSIVLWPDENEPRTLSLVPPVHFVIVDANTLYPDFQSLIEQQQWQKNLPTNVVFISGPSKTADIQQTLAYGAHGPKELIVLLLNS